MVEIGGHSRGRDLQPAFDLYVFEDRLGLVMAQRSSGGALSRLPTGANGALRVASAWLLRVRASSLGRLGLVMDLLINKVLKPCRLVDGYYDIYKL